MANFTKQAIQASFLKLLNQKTLGKISIKDIVEDCGINRNSFYYHYRDLPSLLEEMVTQYFDQLLQQCADTADWDAYATHLLDGLRTNRIALLHLYRSVERDAFEGYLLHFCRYAVKGYNAAVGVEKASLEDREATARLLTATVFGLILEWLKRGAPEEDCKEEKRLLLLLHRVAMLTE